MAQGSYNVFSLVVRRPVATTMLLCALTILGVISYRQLSVQLLPDVTEPRMLVGAWRPGYSVEEVEKEISRPLEALLASTPRVVNISGYARSGYTRYRVTFEFGTDMRFAELEVQEKLNRFSRDFDGQNFGTFVWLYSTSEWDSRFMVLAMKGPADTAALNRLAVDRVEPELSAIDGVARVDIGGGHWQLVDVVFRPDSLEAYGVSIEAASAALRASVAENSYVGAVEEPAETHFVTLHSQIQSLEEIRGVPIGPNGMLRLDDVADVAIREHEQDYLYHYNGANTVGVRLNKDSNANPIVLSGKVRSVLKEIRAQLPPGYDVEIQYDVAEYITDILNQIKIAGVTGALLAMAVLFLFLRSFRMSLIVFIAIPVSIVSTFTLMFFWGISINILTLLGLAIGVGLLVDNSIVVLENIFRHYERSHDANQAAVRGASQVWRALVATTGTNLIVFTPILFTEGNLGLWFREGALAVIFPQIMSLLVALTLVPMLTARMLLIDKLGRGNVHPKWRQWLAAFWRKRNVYWPAYRRRPRGLLREFYGAILRATLRHRVRAVFFVVLVILVTFHVCIPRIRSGVMQTDAQSGYFMVFVTTPAGSRLEDLERAVTAAELTILDLPEIEKTEAWGNLEEGVTIFVKMKKENERKRTTEQVRTAILDEIGPLAGAIASLERPSSEERVAVDLKRGGEVEIYGSDEGALKQVAAIVAERILAQPEIVRAELESTSGLSELHFKLDRERAALAQVSPGSVAKMIGTTSRDGEFSQVYLEQEERRTQIFLRTTETTDQHLYEDIQQLPILTAKGANIPLKDIGRFVDAGGEHHIVRRNLRRVLDLDYYLRPGADPKKAHDAVQKVVDTLHLPAGIEAKMGGNQQRAKENLDEFLWMVGLTLLLIYMVMASIFESLLTPLVIMITLPLGSLGVFWVMAFADLAAEEMALFGMLILIGVVVNNGIVLLDFYHVMRRERGYARTRAMVESCYSRLRPILMTTLTTILALLPMALQQSEEFPWASLAVVVIAGLSTSTILTLVVVPAMLLNAEDTVGFFRRIASWTIRQTVPRIRGSIGWCFRLAARTTLWPVHRFVPGMWEKLGRPKAPAKTITSETPSFVEERGRGKSDRQAVLRQIFMTYPIFRPKHLGRIVPSTRYKYGGRPPEGIDALKGIDLTLGHGMCGLLGPNGAGKTTVMQILAGLLVPTRGYVEVCGVNMAAQRERARRQVGYLPQRFGLPGHLTGRQFLDFHALTMGLRNPKERRQRIERALDDVNLNEAADRRCAGYSTGMKQRLGIARLLLDPPSLLIVDEPTAGLDPIERVKFRNLLAGLSGDRTVLFSTHIIEDISSNCRSLAVIHKGLIAYQGPPSGLIAQARGKVWDYTGAAREAGDLAQIARVLRRKPSNGAVLYRLLCSFRPKPDAQPSEPTLEDAYMSEISEIND